ncbi:MULTISPECIES: hypothetical protein [unclassified Breznakia]|uniref:hypothetical protein n=1 Tax=unclassified Breznakia TaxID=2623764 RepID=UPI002473184E|nr:MULTISPECIES: hypothetical protein [unclassified Breznakia]MDH6367383.1 hypothetical protein [Breznakia sp. PH1-1]MDH6403915.1 hypothetical protein [Breznakia sp. PF1-11]MDH6411624.1 hypothetical protein [Breznakia sp. PFB1-11]MDH6414550.1 hypothetical protein [Breznakia sp. PFB1-14]MDH6418656.1 hypothetical protein [Breznakia sp. PFB1-12]
MTENIKNNPEMKTGNKKKIYLAGGVVVALLLATISFILINNGDSSIKLKKEVVIVELGDEISLKSKDYLDTDDKSILSKTKVSTNAKKVGGIVPVGDYKVDLKYGDELLTQKVQVKDTTSPVFKEPKAKVEVDRDYDGDLATNFKAEDLSEVKITVDTKEVDLKKAGTYKAKAIATDKYKNKTEQAFEVEVGEKTKAEKEAEEKEKAEAENKETEVSNNETQGSNAGTVSNGSTGTTGGTVSGSNNTGTTGNTGGTTQTPVQPAPSEPIVCLYNCEHAGLQQFDNQDEANDWAESIFYDGVKSREYAQKFGYSNLTSFFDQSVHYGYKSTGRVTSIKYVIVFSFK